MAQVLAALPLSQWSRDQSSNHVNDAAIIAALGGNGPIFADTSGPFSFSSGCYMPGHKKYCFPGGGGHTDSANTGILQFDFKRCQWVVTEKSAIYHTKANGLVPLSPDPGNVIQPDPAQTDYFVWPNADGHRTPFAGHTYSTAVWCPEINYGYVGNPGSYPGGGVGLGHNGAYYLWTMDGQWDQQAGLSGGCNGATGVCFWLSAIKKIWLTDISGNAWHWDPRVGAKTQVQTHSFGNGPDGGILADVEIQSPGCLIPDPLNPGDTAYVMWQNGGASLVKSGGFGVAYYPRVGSGATGQISSRLATLTNVPAGQRWAVTLSQASSWFDFAGHYKLGSPYILVWPWACTRDGVHGNLQGDGIWLLNSRSWSYSNSPLPSSAPPYTPIVGGSSGFKNIFVLTDYISVGSYLPICLIGCQPDAVDGVTIGQVYFYKIPWSSL